MKPPRKHPEQDLQKSVAKYLDLALAEPWRWSAFPAGGGGKVRGAILASMGLKAGWPDLLFLHPAGYWRGIELKAPKKGVVSDEQADFIEWADGLTAICRSVDQVEATLRAWGLPLKATTGLRRAA